MMRSEKLAIVPAMPPSAGASAMHAAPTCRLRVLLVDDEMLSSTLVTRLLIRMGHEVRRAANGAVGMRLVDEGWADVLITDLHMPNVDGLELITHVRGRMGNRLPVLMLTSSDDDASLVKALEGGADDYLVKPVSFPVLRAKLNGVARMLEVGRESARQHAKLIAYRDDEEEQNRIAEHLLQSIRTSIRRNDRALCHWIRPMGRFSGDVVVSARTPGGVLHVMLAHATGHGLLAAISLFPLLQPFYTMSVKGYALSVIVSEINRMARRTLPAGRFVAATLIALDAQERHVQIWNGANPPVFALAEDGEVLMRAPSNNFALGVADEPMFSPLPEHFRYEQECQLFACSDGATDYPEDDGKLLGDDGLLEMLRATPPARRLSSVRERLERPVPCAGPDDVAVLTIDCALESRDDPGLDFVAPAQQAHAHGNWKASISLTEVELRRADVVPLLTGFVHGIDALDNHKSNVFLMLAELFNNALDHGLLRLDSSLKQGAGGYDGYLAERARRLDALQDARIDIELALQSNGEMPSLVMLVRDSGPGFLENVIDPKGGAGVLPHGRGIALLKKLCTSIEYRGAGNEVRLVYALTDCV